MADSLGSETSRALPDVSDLLGAPPADGVGYRRRPSQAPDTWFDRKDLLVADLAADVCAAENLMRDESDRLWRYDGGVWRPDTSNSVRSAVTGRLRNRFRPAHDAAVRQFLLGEVDVIRCEPVPNLINVTNGLLDWESGDLYPHTPSVASTVQLTVPWEPEATCPEITSWLAEVLPADVLEQSADGPGFIWEVLGYLCMSGNPLHKAILLIGSGRNGKGTFLRLLTALLGNDNVSSVDLHSLITNRFRKAELFGKVANIAGDIDSSWLESTAEFKAITGGDRVQAERKFGQPFDFTPFAVPVFSANKVFGTSDQSAGFLARWVVIPFPNSFLGRENRSLDARLAQPSELQGLLVRSVEGLRAVMARGNFSNPPSVAEAYEQFEDAADPVRGFLRATTDADPSAWTSRRKLWSAYEQYCIDNGIAKPLTAGNLYTHLAIAGLVPRQRNGDRGFVGCRITDSD